MCLISGYGLVAGALAGRNAPASASAGSGTPEGIAPWTLLGVLGVAALLVLAFRAPPAFSRLRDALRAPRRRVAWTAGLFLVGFGVFLVGEVAGVTSPSVTSITPPGEAITLVRPVAVGGPDGELKGGPQLATLEYREREVWVEALGPGVRVGDTPVEPNTRLRLDSTRELVVGERTLTVRVPALARLLGGAVLGRLAGLLLLLMGLTVFATRLLAPLGIRRPTLAELGRGGLAWLGTLPLYAGAVALGSLLATALGVPSQNHELVRLVEREGVPALGLVFVLAAVLAPLKEELLLRGILLPALSNVWGTTLALLASSVLFALIHLSVAALLPMFVLGLLFGGLRITAPDEDPLTAAVTAHELHNGTTLALVALGMLAS